MLKFIETKSSVLSENTFADKFSNKRVLVIGSGPSVNMVNWKNVDVDVIVTTTFFYLNDNIRNLTNITHITLSEIIDFTDERLHDFLKINPDCTIALEPKAGRPFYNSQTFKIFEERYRDRLVYYNTIIDKKEGAGGRLAFFVMSFGPSELYYVGIDGRAPIITKEHYNVFRPHIIGDPDNYDYQEFLDSHTIMADALYQYSLQYGCKLYNLGEGLDFNCSTSYSSKHYPLTTDIKTKLKV
jgi:hypothetical protein